MFVLAAGLVAACASGAAAPVAPTASSPFNALAVAGVSGPAGATVTACLNGIQAAALVINTEGGILGHRVKLTIYDDQGNTTQGVSLLSQALGSNTSWQYVHSGGNADEALAMTPTLSRAKLVNMLSTYQAQLGDPAVAPYHFVTGGQTQVGVQVLVDYALKQGYKKIGLFTSDSAFGQQENADMQKALKAANASLVSLPFPASAIDLAPHLLQLQAQGVDAVLWSATGAQIGYVLKSRSKIGWKLPFLGDTGVASGDVWTLAGGADNLQNVMYLTYPVTLFRTEAQQTPGFKRFMDALHSVAVTINQPLNLYAVCYDELQAMRAAAIGTNSLDADKMRAYLENSFKPPKDTLQFAPNGWGWTKATHLPAGSPDQFVITKAGRVVDGQIQPPS